MGDGIASETLETAVLSRQQTERVKFDFGVVSLVGNGKSVDSRPRRSEGFDAIVGLVTGSTHFTLEILGAPAVLNKEGGLEKPGTFVLLDSINSVSDPESGLQVAFCDLQVRATYTMCRVVAGPAPVKNVQQTLELVPVYCWKRVDVVSGGSSTPNRSSFYTNQTIVATPGHAVEVAPQAIPDGFAVVVWALPNNMGFVYIGNSAANAENHSMATPLPPRNFLTLSITNTDLVWVDADNGGDGVSITVEI